MIVAILIISVLNLLLALLNGVIMARVLESVQRRDTRNSPPRPPIIQ